MKSINDIIQDCVGYYTMDFSFEDFNGEIIKLKGDELNIFFQRYWNGDEHSFREYLHRRDEWYQTMPYNLWKDNKWMQQTVKHLKKIGE